MATRTIKRPRGFEDETLWDEEHHLLRMDPSLMTARQQLAFLLRTTAHEASDTLLQGNRQPQDVAVASLGSAKKHRRHQQRTVSGRPCPRTKNEGYKKRPRAVDWKRQGTARQDASRYDEKVEVSGSEDDVSRLKATGRPFGDSEPRCACLDMHVEHMLSSTSQLIMRPFRQKLVHDGKDLQGLTHFAFAVAVSRACTTKPPRQRCDAYSIHRVLKLKEDKCLWKSKLRHNVPRPAMYGLQLQAELIKVQEKTTS